MPLIRPFRKEELHTVRLFCDKTQFEILQDALNNGRKVEMIESTFAESPDFCRIQIDGMDVVHINGY